MEFVLAVDIGGTKLAAARVDLTGKVVLRDQVATGTGDAEALWGRLRDLVRTVLGPDRPVGVGVGCGGPMTWPAGDVSPLNIPGWRDFPLRARLAQLVAGIDVRVHNDAVCVAAGEHWRGAGVGSRNMLGIVVSTGVGGGLIVDNRVVDGTTGNAGHVGHVVVEPNGPRCGCGGYGCLEAIARGPAIVMWAQQQGWRSDEDVDGAVLAADARDGDPVALAALTRAGQALGVALASAAHLVELDVVSVGGGLAQAGTLLLGPARDAFDRHAVMAFARRCRIVPAALGQDAGLVGAAALVLAGDRYWSAD